MNWYFVIFAFLCGAWVGTPFGYCFRKALEQSNAELEDQS